MITDVLDKIGYTIDWYRTDTPVGQYEPDCATGHPIATYLP